MRRRCLLSAMVLVLAAAPCLAQGIGHACDPAGTWIGGGDPNVPSYQLTVVPSGAGRSAVTFQLIPDPGVHSTAYTGELVKNPGGTYTIYAMATFGETQEYVDLYESMGITVSVAEQELDAVHAQARLDGCDTMVVTINWFGWYVPTANSKIPFVTQPEVEMIRDFLGGEPIVETYRRVSGESCPICQVGGSALGVPSAAAAAAVSGGKAHPRRGRK